MPTDVPVWVSIIGGILSLVIPILITAWKEKKNDDRKVEQASPTDLDSSGRADFDMRERMQNDRETENPS